MTSAPAAAQLPISADRVRQGNGVGMDTHLFRPAVDSKGFFTVNGSDILGSNDVSFGLVTDYGRNIMRLAPNHGQSALVQHSFQGTFEFNYGIANLFVVGLTAPVNLMSGDEVTAVGPNDAPYDADKLDSQTLANVSLHAKARLTRVEKGVGLAVVVQGGKGTSVPAQRGLGADDVYYWPQLALEKRLGATGRFKLGVNAGYRGHTQQNPKFHQLKEGKFENGNLATGGAAVAWRVIEPLDLVGETYATYLLGTKSDAKVALSQEAVGGIKVFVERNSYLMMGAGTRAMPGFEAADLRMFIGFIFEPSIGDRDGDGYKDDVDQCPDEPEDFDGFKDEDGCPDPDNDQDGILDVDDRCPNVPEDRDGDEDEDGCPEGNDGDRDGDGILDSRDKCPDDPEDRDGFEDADGCPDPDNDKDGILDKDDRCPNDPEDKDGFEDSDGCPEPDNDHDQIPDAQDKCPGTDEDVRAGRDTKETYNGFEDEDGCPDKGSVVIQDNSILILEKILFKKDSAEILPESNAIIHAVATTMVHHPEFLLIEVQGHADERADDNHNLRLTRDRANAVLEALVKESVGRDRLRSIGYGEFCPVDPGHNEVAWEKNRRVEFKVLKTTDGPTGVELGCETAKKKGVVSAPVP